MSSSSDPAIRPLAEILAVLSSYRLSGSDAAAAMGYGLPPRERLSELIGQALGEASMCWERSVGDDNRDRMRFDDAQAVRILERVLDDLLMEFIAAQHRIKDVRTPG